MLSDRAFTLVVTPMQNVLMASGRLQLEEGGVSLSDCMPKQHVAKSKTVIVGWTINIG